MTLRRLERVKEDLKKKRRIEGWVLEKEESSWAPAGTWSNIDQDVAPLSRQTWNSWTLFGYWCSDIISIQSWQTGSTILALGLTWRSAILAIVLGSFVMGIPMALNGYIGGRTHAPFPILARAGFGYHLAKFPVIVRLVTVLFWHGITNWYAVEPMTQIIRSIWPSYRRLPNTLPASAGITTQEMVSYLLAWLVQLPLLMIPPHKMKWLFTAKVAMSLATIIGILAWTLSESGGSGDIWDQQPTVSGSTKSWLVMYSLNSCTASWATVGVNIPDFTRYLRKPRSALTQAGYFPIITSVVAIIGVVVASASANIYGTYVWDPLAIVDSWDGPGGRAAAFFAGISWLIAQICVNVSATTISGANDLVNLFPKWFNIRRGALLITIVASWAMVPWKIITSATSLLDFLGSLGVFLAPTMGIQIADFYIAKRMRLDIPALYQPEGRYRYHYGVNWRALTALAFAIIPALPGLAYNVNPDVAVGGAKYLAKFNWYYGFFVAFVLHASLSFIWPAKETLIPCMINSIEDALEDQQAQAAEKESAIIVGANEKSSEP